MAVPLQFSRQETASRLHLDFLDGLRALAAIFVVVNHAYLTVWNATRSGSSESLPLSLYKYGHFAVTLFIVISGFCLMMPVVRSGTLKGGAKGFYLRRARRILPPYYLALGFSLLLALTLVRQHTGTHWDISIPVTLKGFLSHVTLLNDVYGSSKINHAFWSVAVECHIYLWFPLFVLLWQRWGAWKSACLLLVVSYILAFGLNSIPHTYLVAHYYGLFALGMLSAQIAFGSGSQWEAWRKRVPWLLMSAILIGVVGYSCAHFVHTSDMPLDLAVSLAAMGLLIDCTRPGKNPVRDFLSLKPLVWTGMFSYSIYLIHAPLLQVVWQYALHPLRLSDQATFALLAGPGLLLIVGISYLFFWYCERPFMPVNTLTIRKVGLAPAISPAP